MGSNTHEWVVLGNRDCIKPGLQAKGIVSLQHRYVAMLLSLLKMHSSEIYRSIEGLITMQTPLQITFRGFPHSDAVEANIREKALKLEKFYPHITGCRVVVEAGHHHHHRGNLYHVRIDLTVPQKELVISYEKHDEHSHEDVYVVIRDAFHAARRRLEDYSRMQRGDTKTHEVPLHGTIATLVPEQDYGLIRSSEGNEVYFHRNSVSGKGFEALEVGSEVPVCAGGRRSGTTGHYSAYNRQASSTLMLSEA